jgi:hypothetical protein
VNHNRRGACHATEGNAERTTFRRMTANLGLGLQLEYWASAARRELLQVRDRARVHEVAEFLVLDRYRRRLP